MTKHFERNLDRLKRGILTTGSLVEELMNKATVALVDRRAELAREILLSDDEVDAREVEFEEECLKALALHQPVAGDLRFIVAVMKVNAMLERMADLAINIAERALFLAQHEPLAEPLARIRLMVDKVRAMVRLSLDALVNVDTGLARQVIAQDDEVDDINAGLIRELLALMAADAAVIERAVHMLLISRHLERIADHACNIAEDVVFMVDGEIIRHHAEEYQSKNNSAPAAS
jgi:phosphate transport system protein